MSQPHQRRKNVLVSSTRLSHVIMALAETISRKIHRLGLVPKFIQLLPALSLALALASVAWILALPLEGNYRTTYISENALMPAQATSYFRELEWNLVRGYRQEVRDFAHWPLAARNAEVAHWMNDIGLKTAYHQHGNELTLYAVMHAPRGDHTELMVVAVPWTTSDARYNEGGVALAASLALYFSKMSVWSKNIIFVFPSDGHVALRLWVEAYHTLLPLTAGSIDAAIVMEFAGSSDYFRYFEIAYEGLNGQLPNLDLMNTANLIGYHEGLKYLIQGASIEDLDRNTYWTRLSILVKGIFRLVLAGLTKPTPGCEAFSGWQIQAITIKACGTDGGPDVTQFGRIVDSTLRLVNNLLEKFHQLFFFYLMLSPRYFVSIGTYLPLACLVAGSYAFSALGCLLNSGVLQAAFAAQVGPLLLYFTASTAVCYLLAMGLPALTRLAARNEDSQLQTVTFILMALTLLTVVVALLPLYNQVNRRYYRMPAPLAFLLIALSLFFIGMLIFTLLIVHFTLAICIGLCALPLTWIQPVVSTRSVVSSESTAKRDPLSEMVAWIRRHKSTIQVMLCLFCSSPFFVLYLVGSLVYDQQDGVVALMRGLLTSWDELQCWTWFVVVLGWFNAWLCVGICCAFGDFGAANVKLKSS